MIDEAKVGRFREAEELLDFKRDLIEYAPESFTGDQLVDLLREQRGICGAMDEIVRDDFARREPMFRERLLDSLNGAGGHDRSWWKSYLTGRDQLT